MYRGFFLRSFNCRLLMVPIMTSDLKILISLLISVVLHQGTKFALLHVLE
jgi:hypothetical protein